MSYTVLAASLCSALQRQDTDAIRHLVAEMQLADLAEFIQHEQEDTTVSLLDYLPMEQRASALGYLEEETQSALTAEMEDAMDVAEEEATEDMHKGVSVGKIEGSLRSAWSARTWRSARRWWSAPG